MKHERIRKKALLPLIMWGMVCWGMNEAQAQDVSKYQAVFLYNFTKYIQWPDQKNTIVIGVMGDSDVYQELLRSISAKNIESIQVNKVDTPKDASQCNLVFLSEEHSDLFGQLMTETHNHSVLIVTENESLAEAGAGISFYIESSRLRFKINEKAVSDRHIKISSQLLALGRVI